MWSGYCGLGVLSEGAYKAGIRYEEHSTKSLIEQGKSYVAFIRALLWNKVQQEARNTFYSHPQLCVSVLELNEWSASENCKK